MNCFEAFHYEPTPYTYLMLHAIVIENIIYDENNPRVNFFSLRMAESEAAENRTMEICSILKRYQFKWTFYEGKIMLSGMGWDAMGDVRVFQVDSITLLDNVNCYLLFRTWWKINIKFKFLN